MALKRFRVLCIIFSESYFATASSRSGHFIGVLLINGCRDTLDDDRTVRAALAHREHPCGRRHLHGLRKIRNSDQQNIPCNRVKGEHPPGITGPARKQHNKMDPDKKRHRNIHRENGGKHICNRTNAAFCSARCKNQYNVYKTRAKSREDKENE